VRARHGAGAALAAAVVAAGGVAWAGGGSRHDPGVRTVRVSVDGSGLVPAVATGVAVADGRVLTVAHVLAGSRAPTVLGRRAAVLRVDRRADLALLDVPGLRAPRLRIGGATGTVGIRVLRRGRVRMLTATVRRHVIARVRDAPGGAPQVRPGLELAASIDPGDSGAPVLDGGGRLVGVVFARTHDRPDTAWAVDATAARGLLGD
jgi:S1-C subfamily serine protease